MRYEPNCAESALNFSVRKKWRSHVFLKSNHSQKEKARDPIAGFLSIVVAQNDASRVAARRRMTKHGPSHVRIPATPQMHGSRRFEFEG